MNAGPTIETKRLTLRRWHKADLGPFAALNSDPVVMEHFPQLLDLSGTEQKIGMTHNPDDDFDHPNFLEDVRLRPHVLYRMSAACWVVLNQA